ncbi:hypothetical protein [Ornithinimicrobium sp. W1665]|uniref:hypothetical protein n=1 Tax=Ornithinimicrobium sp. W1665 TaxID=3416666 RepID=UPI003D6BB29C
MARTHIAARLEDTVRARVMSSLVKRGWQQRLFGYTGYASVERARVFARVVLSRHDPEERTALTHAQDSLLDIAQRGWRVFLTAPYVGARVVVRMGDATVETLSDRGGYIDVEVPGHGLPPGWQEAAVSLANGDTVTGHGVGARGRPLGRGRPGQRHRRHRDDHPPAAHLHRRLEHVRAFGDGARAGAPGWAPCTAHSWPRTRRCRCSTSPPGRGTPPRR